MLSEKGNMFNIRDRISRVVDVVRKKDLSLRDRALANKLYAWIESDYTYRRPLP